MRTRAGQGATTTLVPVASETVEQRAEADVSIVSGVRLYRIPDAMRLLSMSRSVIDEHIRAGPAELGHAGAYLPR